VEDTNLHFSRIYKGKRRQIPRRRPGNCEEEMPSSARVKYLGMLLEESLKNSTNKVNYY
jgi:hypothetical protein